VPRFKNPAKIQTLGNRRFQMFIYSFVCSENGNGTSLKEEAAMAATLGMPLEPVLYAPESFSEPALEFDIEDLGHVRIVRVRGDATCDRTAELDERLRSSQNRETRFVILDLAESGRFDPEALTTLADYARDLRRTGGEVWLADLQPATWLALRAARLDRLFTIRASMAQGLQS
jgi:anti-anti-sigma factor